MRFLNNLLTFIGRIWIPGMMFACVCFISYLPYIEGIGPTPEEMAKTVTVGEALRAFQDIGRIYILLMLPFFAWSFAGAAIQWVESRKRENEISQ